MAQSWLTVFGHHRHIIWIMAWKKSQQTRHKTQHAMNFLDYIEREQKTNLLFFVFLFVCIKFFSTCRHFLLLLWSLFGVCLIAFHMKAFAKCISEHESQLSCLIKSTFCGFSLYVEFPSKGLLLVCRARVIGVAWIFQCDSDKRKFKCSKEEREEEAVEKTGAENPRENSIVFWKTGNQMNNKCVVHKCCSRRANEWNGLQPKYTIVNSLRVYNSATRPAHKRNEKRAQDEEAKNNNKRRALATGASL